MKTIFNVLIGIYTLFVLAFTSVSVFAEDALKGDIDYGEYLSTECITCHQISGEDDGIPSIIGWDSHSFVVVLQSYKSGERENPVMQTIAKSLDDEAMSSLALYFESLETKTD